MGKAQTLYKNGRSHRNVTLLHFEGSVLAFYPHPCWYFGASCYSVADNIRGKRFTGGY